MTRLVFDIETNDLPPNVKNIWCIVAKDLDTKHVYTFGPESIEEGIAFLQKADYLVGHNIIGFMRKSIMNLGKKGRDSLKSLWP